MLTTNMIRKDLNSANQYDAGVALGGLSCFITPGKYNLMRFCFFVPFTFFLVLSKCAPSSSVLVYGTADINVELFT